MKLIKIIFVATLFIIGSCSNYGTKKNYAQNNQKYVGNTRLTLAKETTGDNNVLMIPGGPGIDSDYLTNLAKDIEPNGKVWLVDLPNNGTNEIATANGSTWMDDLLETVESVENPILVGHSYGGLMILKDARLNEKAKGFVLLDTPHNHPFKDLDYAMKQNNLPDYHGVLDNYTNTPNAETYDQLVKVVAKYHFRPEYYKTGINTMNSLKQSHHFKDRMTGVYIEEPIVKYIPTIPTLVVAGEYDYATPIQTFLQDNRFNKDNFRFAIIEDSGHYPFVEKPQQTSKTISNFIRRVS